MFEFLPPAARLKLIATYGCACVIKFDDSFSCKVVKRIF
ncbi:hypothetical protein CAMSH0001_2227 [Campylobacter showae RM3277]|uniref:Uncharacterized protein n=1 Tax=Campylobacter showae RM3277 TaxID=553219 RepID=C6RFW3_9BACT|nr:hypothetical protein CAMSH0001_2227 [Campylobacter showae RM3277]